MSILRDFFDNKKHPVPRYVWAVPALIGMVSGSLAGREFIQDRLELVAARDQKPTGPLTATAEQAGVAAALTQDYNACNDGREAGNVFTCAQESYERRTGRSYSSVLAPTTNSTWSPDQKTPALDLD